MFKSGNIVVCLGNAKNLTNDARMAGAGIKQGWAMSNQSNRMASGLASELRAQGYTFSAITTKLNENGFKTPNGNARHCRSVS